jgi:hypothetical protein
MGEVQREGDVVLHQRAIEELIDQRIAASGSSAEGPRNWATFRLGANLILTPGVEGRYYTYVGEDFLFSDWSGNNVDPAEPNDFFLDTFDVLGDGSLMLSVIRSTRGGMFQATMMAGSPVPDETNPPDDPPLVLDADFQHTRYLWLGAIVGDPATEGGIRGIGIDMVVPIITGGLEGQNVMQTATSSPGYTPQVAWF